MLTLTIIPLYSSQPKHMPKWTYCFAYQYYQKQWRSTEKENEGILHHETSHTEFPVRDLTTLYERKVGGRQANPITEEETGTDPHRNLVENPHQARGEIKLNNPVLFCEIKFCNTVIHRNTLQSNTQLAHLPTTKDKFHFHICPSCQSS